MEMTKAQLENERKIQQLQMQAINALWKKVSSMQNNTVTNVATSVDVQGDNGQTTTSAASSTVMMQSNTNTLSLDNSSTTVVNDLAKTCGMLTNQVKSSSYICISIWYIENINI